MKHTLNSLIAALLVPFDEHGKIHERWRYLYAPKEHYRLSSQLS